MSVFSDVVQPGRPLTQYVSQKERKNKKSEICGIFKFQQHNI